MKAYQIVNLEVRILKQEDVIKAIKRNLTFAHIKPWRKAQLEELLAKEIRVLNAMTATLERRS